jgi:hypothetical protein
LCRIIVQRNCLHLQTKRRSSRGNGGSERRAEFATWNIFFGKLPNVPEAERHDRRPRQHLEFSRRQCPFEIGAAEQENLLFFQIASGRCGDLPSLSGYEQVGLARAAIGIDSVGAHVSPVGGRVAGFFEQFAPGSRFRLFARFDEAAHRGQCDAHDRVLVLSEDEESPVFSLSEHIHVVRSDDPRPVVDDPPVRHLDSV